MSAELNLLRPVRAGNAFEETVERLLRLINLGIVPPGQRLPAERELALRLGVSRATLREALGALHKAGWVEVRRGRNGGTFVRRDDASAIAAERTALSSPAQVEDVLRCRWALEVGAAEIAASQLLSAAVRRELREHLAAVEAAPPAEYRRCDSRLHLALASATGSERLARCVADSRTEINALLGQIPILEPNLRHSNLQHRAIIDAVLGGDPAAARAAMMDHLDGTAALLRGFLT